MRFEGRMNRKALVMDWMEYMEERRREIKKPPLRGFLLFDSSKPILDSLISLYSNH